MNKIYFYLIIIANALRSGTHGQNAALTQHSEMQKERKKKKGSHASPLAKTITNNIALGLNNFELQMQKKKNEMIVSCSVQSLFIWYTTIIILQFRFIAVQVRQKRSINVVTLKTSIHCVKTTKTNKPVQTDKTFCSLVNKIECLAR